MATLPYLSQGAGIPTQQTESLTSNHQDLIVGEEPRVFTQDNVVEESVTIAELSVVGYNADGLLVPAVWHATYSGGGVRPIGIAVIGITTGSGEDTTGLPVYRAGCFNIDAIAWPASFDTDAKKFGAFNGSPTPTTIVLRRVKQATV